MLDQIQLRLESLAASFTHLKYFLFLWEIQVQLEMSSQAPGLREYFLTMWTRDHLSLMNPFDVRFQVTNHAESIPTMRTSECFFGSVSLFMALQKFCGPEGHVASIALVTSLGFCMNLLVIHQVGL